MPNEMLIEMEEILYENLMEQKSICLEFIFLDIMVFGIGIISAMTIWGYFAFPSVFWFVGTGCMVLSNVLLVSTAFKKWRTLQGLKKLAQSYDYTIEEYESPSLPLSKNFGLFILFTILNPIIVVYVMIDFFLKLYNFVQIAKEVKKRKKDGWELFGPRTRLEYLKFLAIKAHKSIKNMIGSPQARERIQKNKLGDTTLLIDKTAEDVILTEVRKINQNVKVITEETGEFFTQFETDEISDCLIIDPIDGSHNASFGFPMSCISIAYARGPRLENVVTSVILDIYTGDLYSAIKGKGAYKNEEKDPIQVNTRKDIPKCLFGMNLSVDEPLSDFVNRYLEFFDKCKPLRIREIGTDAFALTLVGMGKLDLFMNLQNKTRVLDIAAAALILKEAGGLFIDPNGVNLNPPLTLMTRLSFIGISPTLKAQLDPLIPILSKCFKNQPIIK